jgi:hypothetical protein
MPRAARSPMWHRSRVRALGRLFAARMQARPMWHRSRVRADGRLYTARSTLARCGIEAAYEHARPMWHRSRAHVSSPDVSSKPRTSRRPLVSYLLQSVACMARTADRPLVSPRARSTWPTKPRITSRPLLCRPPHIQPTTCMVRTCALGRCGYRSRVPPGCELYTCGSVRGHVLAVGAFCVVQPLVLSRPLAGGRPCMLRVRALGRRD